MRAFISYRIPHTTIRVGVSENIKLPVRDHPYHTQKGKSAMRMFVGGHLMTVKDNTVRYRRTNYPLTNARARIEAQGWRGQRRRIIVEGPSFQFTTGTEKYQRTAYKALDMINNAAMNSTQP